jgi:hypothetical protein
MSEGYVLTAPALGITLEADRLRRDRNELIGELTVRCTLPGAITVNGCLSVADFNFSSARARQDRAKLLKERAKTNGSVDWVGLLEEFCQQVFTEERQGPAAVDLRTLARPTRDDEIRVAGLVFPRRHPSILFGDGGAAKSYTALWIAGQLAQQGLNVGLWDWELCGDDHRDRLERLFGPTMPRILYCRCDRPLTAEVDGLRRIVRDSKIDFAIFDSVAFACDGPPEAAEVAGRYFRAVREIACGSLHIAHVNKSEDNDRKPFGSSFWHNGARTTWFVKASDASDATTLRLGFYNRKSNLGPLQSDTSFTIHFTDEKTEFRSADIADSPDLAAGLSVSKRMALALRRGSMTPEEIAHEISAKVETIERTARRNKGRFVVLSGDRIGLSAR